MINSILAVPVMNLIVFIAAIIMYLVRRTCQQIIKFHPYADFDVHDFAALHNCTFEEHEIETEDGYLLTTFRLRFPDGAKKRDSSKLPVLIVHGLMANCECFLFLSENCLPFLLVDEGYDVWMMNVRGTKYSKKHVKYSPVANKEFWNFSWHEIGLYDISANIDYVLNKTGSSQLFYIGHSQGTTAFTVLTSILPDYNSKIRLAILFNPPVYVSNQEMIGARLMKPFYNRIRDSIIRYRIYEFMPYRKSFIRITKTICALPGFLNICYFFYDKFFVGPFNVDEDGFRLITAKYPDTCSTKQLLHFFQVYVTDEFAWFNYGERKNLQIYGAAKPPLYNLTNVRSPIAVFYGNVDKLCVPKDVEKTISQLPNLVYSELLEGNWGHIDFLAKPGVETLLYPKVIKLFNDYK